MWMWNVCSLLNVRNTKGLIKVFRFVYAMLLNELILMFVFLYIYLHIFMAGPLWVWAIVMTSSQDVIQFPTPNKPVYHDTDFKERLI